MCQKNVDNVNYENAKKISEKFDSSTPVHSQMIAAEMEKREKENILKKAKAILGKF